MSPLNEVDEAFAYLERLEALAGLPPVTSRHDACPDHGTCHHKCADGRCFRVECCGPLSGQFPGDRWPEGIRRQYGGPDAIRPRDDRFSADAAHMDIRDSTPEEAAAGRVIDGNSPAGAPTVTDLARAYQASINLAAGARAPSAQQPVSQDTPEFSAIIFADDAGYQHEGDETLHMYELVLYVAYDNTDEPGEHSDSVRWGPVSLSDPDPSRSYLNAGARSPGTLAAADAALAAAGWHRDGDSPWETCNAMCARVVQA